MPYIRLKLKQNKLSMTWVIKRWNSSHKSGSALKQGVPGLFLCAEHGTNLTGESPVTGIYRQV